MVDEDRLKIASITFDGNSLSVHSHKFVLEL